MREVLYFHSTDEEIESQRGKVTCAGSHSQVTESGLRSGSSVPKTGSLFFLKSRVTPVPI